MKIWNNLTDEEKLKIYYAWKEGLSSFFYELRELHIPDIARKELYDAMKKEMEPV